MDNKIEIEFTCTRIHFSDGQGTLFWFYPNGIWDEHKLTIEEAINKYPPHTYEWLHVENNEL